MDCGTLFSTLLKGMCVSLMVHCLAHLQFDQFEDVKYQTISALSALQNVFLFSLSDVCEESVADAANVFMETGHIFIELGKARSGTDRTA